MKCARPPTVSCRRLTQLTRFNQVARTIFAVVVMVLLTPAAVPPRILSSMEGIVPTWAADTAKFRNAQQSSFVVRYNKFVEYQRDAFARQQQAAAAAGDSNEAPPLRFSVDPASLRLFLAADGTFTPPATKEPATSARMNVRNSADGSALSVLLYVSSSGIVRLTIDESSPTPLRPRFSFLHGDDVVQNSRLEAALKGSRPGDVRFRLVYSSSSAEPVQLRFDCPHVRLNPLSSLDRANSASPPKDGALGPGFAVIVNFDPFVIDLLNSEGELLQQVNGRQLLNFERYRHQPSMAPGVGPDPGVSRDSTDSISGEASDSRDLKEAVDNGPSNAEGKLEPGLLSIPGGPADSDATVEIVERCGQDTSHKCRITIGDRGHQGRLIADSPPIEPPAGAYEPVQETHPRVFDATAVDPSENAWLDQDGLLQYGPSAVGVDMKFPGAHHVFGFPSHTTPLSLPEYSEPYRSWNLDVFEYELDSPMALYGSVPLLIAQRAVSESTEEMKMSYSGLLWVNPADTWIWLTRKWPPVEAESPAMGMSVDELRRLRADPTQLVAGRATATEARAVSETGMIDIFMFVGSTLGQVLRQYHIVSGAPMAAPLFSLGKHQCRWNYVSVDQVLEVNSGFNQHDIPFDVVWLDIEHTNDKRYFTWNPDGFSDPERMLQGLLADRRYLVAIVDPHIKVTNDYLVYKTLRSQELLIRNADGKTPFEGWCWPGTSVYPDFLNPKVREVFHEFYQPSFWNGTGLKNVFVWNDMNEPSVFNKPEITCPRNARHLDNREHREVHNLYALYFHRTTYEALQKRDPDFRPFVLSRGFFVGSHRYGAIWTGDNMAKWNHLRISVPMTLNHALAGISFVGADVGGFFGNPSSELFLRWMQQGIWYPFFRAHAHIETNRREPWFFPTATLARLRSAIVLRYRLMPLWHTLSLEYSVLHTPMIRPLWWSVASPFDLVAQYHDEEFFVGDDLLVRLVGYPMEHYRRLAGAKRGLPAAVELFSKSSPDSGEVTEFDDTPKISLPESPGSEGVAAGSSVPNEGVSHEDDTAVPPGKISVFFPSTTSTEDGDSMSDKNSTSVLQWYDLHTGKPVVIDLAARGEPRVKFIHLGLDTTPVFVRAGAILFTRDRLRRSTALQLQDPVSMHIYSSTSQLTEMARNATAGAVGMPWKNAEGRIFLDDGYSFGFMKNQRFAYDKIIMRSSTIRRLGVSEPASFDIVNRPIGLDFSDNPAGSEFKFGSSEQLATVINIKCESVWIYGLQSPPRRVVFQEFAGDGCSNYECKAATESEVEFQVRESVEFPTASELTLEQVSEQQGNRWRFYSVELKLGPNSPVQIGRHNWRLFMEM